MFGFLNVECFRKELFVGFIGYEVLDNEVDMDLFIVEFLFFVDCKVILSKI